MCRQYGKKSGPYVRVCQAALSGHQGEHLTVPPDWQQIGCLNAREYAHLHKAGYGRCVGHSRPSSPNRSQPVTRSAIGAGCSPAGGGDQHA